MVLLESPTNPLLKIADIKEICSAVKAHAPNALVVVETAMIPAMRSWWPERYFVAES
jgi:cystathionine beta-lyase/cystathionine gamma-synthase